MKRLLFFLICILIAHLTVRSQGVVGSSNAFYFKNWLIANKEYSEYTIELKHLINAFPQIDSLKDELIEFYISRDEVDSSLYYYNIYYPSERVAHNEYLFERKLNILVMDKKPDTIKQLIRSENPLQKDVKDKFYLSTLILEQQWSIALKMYDTLDKNNQQIETFAPIIKEIKKPYKSPYLAMAMSAVIPGSGKMYSGRKKDGLVSFAMIGLFTWQSIVGFERRGVRSVFGWVNGGLAGGLYLSGIYGAYKAAKWYNRKKDENIYNLLYYNNKYSLLK